VFRLRNLITGESCGVNLALFIASIFVDMAGVALEILAY